MKFKMNDRDWEIIELGQEDMCAVYNETVDTSNGEYFGITIPEKQKILLWDNITEEQKRKTLLHELMHCYMFSYISFNDINFKIDDFCDISANSHDIIHEIVEDYFKRS